MTKLPFAEDKKPFFWLGVLDANTRFKINQEAKKKQREAEESGDSKSNTICGREYRFQVFSLNEQLLIDIFSQLKLPVEAKHIKAKKEPGLEGKVIKYFIGNSGLPKIKKILEFGNMCGLSPRSRNRIFLQSDIYNYKSFRDYNPSALIAKYEKDGDSKALEVLLCFEYLLGLIASAATLIDYPEDNVCQFKLDVINSNDCNRILIDLLKQNFTVIKTRNLHEQGLTVLYFNFSCNCLDYNCASDPDYKNRVFFHLWYYLFNTKLKDYVSENNLELLKFMFKQQASKQDLNQIKQLAENLLKSKQADFKDETL